MTWPEVLTLILGDARGWQRVVTVGLVVIGAISWKYLSQMKASLTRINGEFKNNGGSTMKDSLDRIERMQEEHSAYLGDLAVRMADVENKQNKKRRWFS